MFLLPSSSFHPSTASFFGAGNSSRLAKTFLTFQKCHHLTKGTNHFRQWPNSHLNFVSVNAGLAQSPKKLITGKSRWLFKRSTANHLETVSIKSLPTRPMPCMQRATLIAGRRIVPRLFVFPLSRQFFFFSKILQKQNDENSEACAHDHV